MSESANAEHLRIFQERLQERAYELWQEAGSPEGQSEHFWRLAERTVKAEEKDYDNALKDSFPASDPPANSGFTN